MSDISLEKLAHLIIHKGCDNFHCHYHGNDKCPLWDTLCATDREFILDSVNIEEEVTKAMEHHGIVRGDLLNYLVDR